MVKAKDYWLSWKHSPSCLHDLNHKSTLLEAKQQDGLLPSVVPSTFSADVTVPVFPFSGLPDSRTSQSTGVNGCFQNFSYGLNGSLLTHDAHFRESQLTFANGHGVNTTAVNTPKCCGLNVSLLTHEAHFRESQLTFANGLGANTTEVDIVGYRRKLLIFDKSEHQTRMFSSAFCSAWQNPITGPTEFVHACGLHDENQPAIDEQISPIKPFICEESDENYKLVEGSEMHENTEEINALLYSDDDYNDDDDYDDYSDGDDLGNGRCSGGDVNDEVISTGRSPSIIKGIYGKHEQVEEIIGKVASSNSSAKRQRLLDGGYRASSLRHAASSLKLDSSSSYYDDDDDADSHYANGRILGKDMDSIIGKNLSSSKIHETLRVLESIIPGIKSNDPLLIIDGAISYLKYIKHKARSLGVN